MRTITKTFEVFKFNELSEQAKNYAICHYADTNAWAYDYEAVLRDFCERFNVIVSKWEVGAYQPIVKTIFVRADPGEEVCGLRLRTWIINNFWDDLYNGKYFSTAFKQVPVDAEHPTGLSYKCRYSRIMQEKRCLTGFCAGYTILDAIHKFLEDGWKNEPHKTWEDIVEECVDDFFSEWRSDMEYSMSEDGFEEECEANDWEFTEDGLRYCA